MGLFKKIKDAKEEKDVLGGSRLFDTGLHDFVIENAFFTESKGGATAVNIHAKCLETDKVLKFQEWVTSGDDKDNAHYYEKNGETHYLPGFLTINAIFKLTLDDFELFDLDDEDEDHLQTKTVNLYSAEEKKEVPTEVLTIMPLLGEKITFGIFRQIVDKRKKNEKTKKYEPTGETREENVVNKVFQYETRLTNQEIVAGKEEPEFANKWAEQYNETLNRAKGASDDSGAKKGAPKSSGDSDEAPKKKKVFGNKNKQG